MTAQGGEAALREPANLVSPRAVGYWRVTGSIMLAVVLVAVLVAWLLTPPWPWYAWVGAALAIAGTAVPAVVAPPIRYRVHRWEVTEAAVFTRSGWIGRQQRIAPLNRVQTVDTRQGALQRLFGLASITVTTASAAGPVVIDCLDERLARQVVADLTERTSAEEGDAT